MEGWERHRALVEHVGHTAPGERAVAQALMARLLEDSQWLEVLASGRPVQVWVPYFAIADEAMVASLHTLLATKDLGGFYSAEAPSGCVVVKEDRHGVVTLRYFRGPLPVKAAVVAVSPREPERSKVGPQLAANLARVRSGQARRVVLAPARRPYLHELVVALGAQPLDAATIRFEAPRREEILACEEAFLEAVAKDLEGGTWTVTGRARRHGFQELFSRFPSYDAQVVGWGAGASRYVYLRYRLATLTHLPPLDQEYDVKDGGSAYFEYQCQLPQRALFNVYVHGEA